VVRAARQRLILGSASPRRAALLESLRVPFVVEAGSIDEESVVHSAERDPRRTVARIAQAKFAAFARAEDDSSQLLTADTLVACDGVIMGKPQSSDHLTDMLRQMSGRSLTIATAVCFGVRGSVPAPEIVATTVGLRDLSGAEIAAYVAGGSGMDKAGGLALQAEANHFIEAVEGCWSNVLGFPLCAVATLLKLEPSSSQRDQRCSVDLCGDRWG
jgi:septum formation protein